MMRGEVFRLPPPTGTRRDDGHAVVLQADELSELGTVLVAPTSTRARAASFRPVVELRGTQTRVLVEQTAVVDPQRLGASAGRLDAAELRAVDDGLRVVLGL
jgi:mRNA interferase MazF